MRYGFLIEIFCKTFAYAGVLAGLWLLTHPVIWPILNQRIKSIKNHSRLRRLQVSESFAQQKKKFYLYRHLELLLGAAWPWYRQSTAFYFVLITIALFLASSTVYFKITSRWYLAAGLGVPTSLLPYLSLVLVLLWKRSETSYELVPAINILLGKYRVNARNIYYALLDTIKEMEQYATLQKSLIKLASAIQNHRSREDLENAVELFVFQIGTSWAKQLGIIILNAQWEGKDVELSLSNIVRDMGKAREIMEQDRSNNQDTIQIGYFVPLIAFPASLVLLSKVSTPARYIYYQFKTPRGLTSFIVTVMVCLVGLVVSLLLKKPRNDI